MRAAPAIVLALAALVCAPHEPAATPRNSDGSARRLPPGPASRPPFTLVFSYEDFGPPTLASGLLGPEWWSWEPGGSWEPGDSWDVRVVVYRGLSAAQVAAEYPTLADRADYRHVTYNDALDHLARGVADTAGDPALARAHATLLATRARIQRALGAG